MRERLLDTVDSRVRDVNLAKLAGYVNKITVFTEESSPEDSLFAQRLHAQSYLDMGYIDYSALTADGRLLKEIDTARGSNVLYYLGASEEAGGAGVVSLRKKFIPKDGDLTDLSAFTNCRESLFIGEEGGLREHIKLYGSDAVVEISALSKSTTTPSMASMELIRFAVHDSVMTNPHERWLILFTEPAYRGIKRFFGPTVARQAGEVSLVSEGSDYINPELRFIPAIIEPAKVIDILTEESESSLLSEQERSRRLNALMFMSRGIPLQSLSDEYYNKIKGVGKKVMNVG